ncbi:MAG TPA: hypothetical protein PKD00_08730, partial [Burkholderiales bacterium]|nr:hypothetical protein [Burkholderiales bacterium]
SQPSGRKLDELYKFAWRLGLKTTYYLRTLAATSAEKSTGQGGELNAVSIDGGEGQFGSRSNNNMDTENNFCSIDNPECESCQ